jgi:hypothetical protein
MRTMMMMPPCVSRAARCRRAHAPCNAAARSPASTSLWLADRLACWRGGDRPGFPALPVGADVASPAGSEDVPRSVVRRRCPRCRLACLRKTGASTPSLVHGWLSYVTLIFGGGAYTPGCSHFASKPFKDLREFVRHGLLVVLCSGARGPLASPCLLRRRARHSPATAPQ